MVSVIIPVYNTVKYLRNAVSSIYDQSYTKWEIILVDDGSTDGSSLLCDELTLENSKVSVFHQENKGSAVARNIGIKLAKGKYLAFIDSDDEVPKNFLEVMVQEIEKNADIVFCGLRRINNAQIIEQLYEDAVYNIDEYYIATYDKSRFKTRSSCTALYKKEIVDKNKITFQENLACGEDSLFVLKYISFCDKNIVTTSRCYYDYVNQNPNSITKNIFFNHYILDYIIYKISYMNSIDKEDFLLKTGQRYLDIMIKELIRFVAYSDESFFKKLRQVRLIIKDDLIHHAATNYIVEVPEHSKLIPWSIKKKLTLLTFLAIKCRIKRTNYKKEKVKIRSIWKLDYPLDL